MGPGAWGLIGVHPEGVGTWGMQGPGDLGCRVGGGQESGLGCQDFGVRGNLVFLWPCSPVE